MTSTGWGRCPDRRPSPSGGCNKSSAEASRTRAPRVTGGTVPGVWRSTAWAMGRTVRRICYGTEMRHMLPESWACVIRDAKFWNNYEFIFIGTQTHLPQKLFFPRISAALIYFANVGKCNILKRVKKKVSEIFSFLGETCPANFSTGGDDAFPVPPFGAHEGTNACEK